MTVQYRVFQQDCLDWLRKNTGLKVHLFFVDPPFNQGKEEKKGL